MSGASSSCVPAPPDPIAEAGDEASTAVVASVRTRVAAALADAPPLVLAVSGGRDSTVLLDAALAVARGGVLAVATFDHGTGPAARAAVAHVRALAQAAGMPVRVGRAPAGLAPTEATWRVARWRFLRRVAGRVARAAGLPSVAIATGHTEDDQLETVLMRVLRGAGPRGLAGMLAPARGVVRPLLGTSAAEVAAYAAARGLAWVDDPSNARARHLRNRVRHHLVPAAERARPDLRAGLLAAAREAAGWRAAVERAAGDLVLAAPGAPLLAPGEVAVPLAPLADHGADALGVLWPALAARAGVRLDRRGTARLVLFTMQSVKRLAGGQWPSGRVPLAGGAEAALERLGRSPERAMVVRRVARHASDAGAPASLALSGPAAGGCYTAANGVWRFTPVADADARNPWRMWLDAGRRYVVRGWRPGDRMRVRSDGPARRVKRYLADRHVPAGERAGWPVVVALAADASDAADEAGGEIVWIPGVRRSDAAPARPGLPGLVLHCDRTRRP